MAEITQFAEASRAIGRARVALYDAGNNELAHELFDVETYIFGLLHAAPTAPQSSAVAGVTSDPRWKRIYDTLAKEGGGTWATYMMMEIDEAIKVAAPSAPAADEVRDWVSVEDRLPGEQGFDSEEVLCFLNGHCDLHDMDCRKGGGWGIRLGFYDAEKACFRVFGRPTAEVTHWQPFPAPPAAIRAKAEADQ